MKITLQDSDVRLAIKNHLASMSFTEDKYDVLMDFTKARKTGLLSVEVELRATEGKTPEPVVDASPLNFSDD